MNTVMVNENHKRVIMMGLVVFAIGLAVNFAVAWKLGFSEEMQSDSLYFRELAENLAEGRGYMFIDNAYWRNEPTMTRMPGWPFVSSLVLRLFPSVSPDLVMRLTNIVIATLGAVMVFCLSVMLVDCLTVSFVASLFYILHPMAVCVCYAGLSEPLFVLLAVSGVCLLLAKPTFAQMCGCVVLGLACLVRANFVLMPVMCVAVGAVHFFSVKYWCKKWLLLFCLGCVLLFMPPALWAFRNYKICHNFPVFMSLSGQVLYGGNNEVVSKPGQYWGHWIFPDNIPGETSLRELSQQMTEYEADKYYADKGKAM